MGRDPGGTPRPARKQAVPAPTCLRHRLQRVLQLVHPQVLGLRGAPEPEGVGGGVGWREAEQGREGWSQPHQSGRWGVGVVVHLVLEQNCFTRNRDRLCKMG